MYLQKKILAKQLSTLSIIITLILLLTACANDLLQHKQDPIEQLLSLMAGTYAGQTSSAANNAGKMTDLRMRINAPAISPYAMYWEVRTGPEQKLYRQRLLTYSLDALTDEIIQQTWMLNDNLEWPTNLDKNAFVELTKDEVNSQLGKLCVNKWKKVDQGWRSYLDPKSCRIWSERRQKFRRIEGESLLTKESLSQAERGYSDSGMQKEFGTPQGELHSLQRQ